ncbi:MAG: hypothetical protein K0U74_09310 [Alphaproteobacteria bacterium]|nr:hypothetical protein [Alphaproteobacteria bacterium]
MTEPTAKPSSQESVDYTYLLMIVLAADLTEMQVKNSFSGCSGQFTPEQIAY